MHAILSVAPFHEPREALVRAAGPPVEVLTIRSKKIQVYALVRRNNSYLIMVSHGARMLVSWVAILAIFCQFVFIFIDTLYSESTPTNYKNELHLDH